MKPLLSAFFMAFQLISIFQMITASRLRGILIAFGALSFCLGDLSIASTLEDIAGIYDLTCKEKFSAKGYGKDHSTDSEELVFRADSTFTLGDIEGTFNISPSNKKILVQVEDSSLNNIEDGCAEILSDLAIDKGVSLEPWEITCLVQTVKLSKLKIRKEAAEAKGKLKIKVKGVASFEVDGDMKEKKFSYKKGCEIIKKKARIDDYYVAFGDSITFGSDDDIMADGFGYPPVLDDLLENYTGFIHTIVNAGIPGEKSIDGLARVQSLINSHPQATIFLILFGTNDSRALGTVPVPSGLKYYGLDPGDPGYGELLDPGDPGYDGSFLDNMQQIIDAIVASGKTPILAKIPFAFGPCGGGCEPFTDPDSASRNILIQDYNTVINALVADNGISVTPPDFYEHFRANPEEFNDNIHPDGTGYQSMADLWFDALLP